MSERDPYRRGLPRALRVPRNWAGLLGAALTVGSVVTFVFLLLVELNSGLVNPYIGLLNYLILPVVGIIGLLLFAGGRWLRNHASARGLTHRAGSFTLIDLSRIRSQQSMLLVTAGFAGGLVFLMSVGGVRAIEYTESEAFCGDVCHTVMRPEATAHAQAPHASIPCVDCHVGSGMTSFVQAKIRGIRQVVGVVTNTYPRPIPTPIRMRPAKETCQRCHWSEYNREEKPLRRQYYLTEGRGAPWVLEMAVKLGGGTYESGFSEGVHWHMNLASSIEYLAVDAKRQEIAWVRYRDSSGTVTEYHNQDLEPDPETVAAGELVQMDCMTCHNRPAHPFEAPTEALNREFRIGNLNPDVPGIRSLALEFLAADYDTTDAALETVDRGLRDGIQEEDAGWADRHPGQLEATIAAVQRVFARSQFPEMKVRWDEFPDNKKHWNSPGCFRCHAANMVSADGRQISYACNTCHIIRGQGRAGQDWQYDPEGLAFIHPPDGELMEAPVLCYECHDGSLGF